MYFLGQNAYNTNFVPIFQNYKFLSFFDVRSIYEAKHLFLRKVVNIKFYQHNISNHLTSTNSRLDEFHFLTVKTIFQHTTPYLGPGSRQDFACYPKIPSHMLV